ncbi:MAG: GLPGLI family protein [Flavobacteriaceae bacterium]|nr:GLPGLI family protein [Flavobacteriaceae bacterium]
MKKIIMLIIIGLTNNSYSQNNKILKVEYNEIVSYIPSIINNDKGLLYVSNEESYYKTIYDNTQNTDKIDNESIVVPAIEGEYFSEIFIDTKNHQLFENIFERIALKKYFSVYEKTPEMNWKYINEEKTISNFKCKKAKTLFRGRTYVVWYTEEIPISTGPWKFYGLPGLILSVEDSEGIFKWYATKIIYPFKEKINFEEVKKRMKKYNKISFIDLDTKIIKSIKTKFETLKAREGGRSRGVIFGFSTSQWKEPTNEYRKKTKYSF